jgi:hypothetical protein
MGRVVTNLVRRISIPLWLGALALPSLASAQAGASFSRTESKVDPFLGAATEATELSSGDVARMRQWVNASGDNHGMPFLIIDKTEGTVFAFDPAGELIGATPALLGSAIGDSSTPGIGDRELSGIPPEERTTPAGRFVATYGIARGDARVLWVDFATSLSLHPVATGTRAERRVERLNSFSPEDNRITYGCINVVAEFYNDIIRPLFQENGGVVYIIPEIKTLDEVFPLFREPPRLSSRR